MRDPAADGRVEDRPGAGRRQLHGRQAGLAHAVVDPLVLYAAAFRRLQGLGVGRENHKMMLEHYSQTKCLLVSYDKNPMGFF